MQKCQIKFALTQRDEHWLPFFFVLWSMFCLQSMNDINLNKILIQQLWGVRYLNWEWIWERRQTERLPNEQLNRVLRVTSREKKFPTKFQIYQIINLWIYTYIIFPVLSTVYAMAFSINILYFPWYMIVSTFINSQI